jgi:hypothetical protein
VTTIRNPTTRVLDLADPEDVDQPAPPTDVRSWSGEIAPVTEACERCGCYWILDPDAVLPDGHAECCFCRMWRGKIHRDARLSEYTDSGGASTGETETIEALNASSMPVYDPEAANIDAEDAEGVVEFIERGEDT